jgi:hypothetical protein
LPVPPRGTPGREGSPPRLASVCAGRQRRHAPWHAPTPARGGPKHCRRSPPLRHPPPDRAWTCAPNPCPASARAPTSWTPRFDSRPGGIDSAVPLPARQAGAIYRRDMRPRPFFVGLAGAGKARPWRRQDAPSPSVGARRAVAACLLLYFATTQQSANSMAVSLGRSPPVNGRRGCCVSPLTARPFGATVLLVGNERISLQANPATLAVAQSRTLGSSNSRSLKPWNSSSLHLSLSKTLGRANAQTRQVDMYTSLVHAYSRMLQPAP